ncbi:hypothetical protein AWB67_05121 [Caballeronia terrestris]|uniref:Uncharacterized protein n=1 Tax=Caballeronia terrestris TaxID=1226301 RepID=A0A158K9W6_9BURK|nr:hypothetical protein AWB67_05121 [Caballeronia terrestris]
MADQHKPGDKVQTSGIYKVVREGGDRTGFEVTSVEGEHFPPTRSGKALTMSWSMRPHIRTSTANSAAATNRGRPSWAQHANTG